MLTQITKMISLNLTISSLCSGISNLRSPFKKFITIRLIFILRLMEVMLSRPETPEKGGAGGQAPLLPIPKRGKGGRVPF